MPRTDSSQSFRRRYVILETLGVGGMAAVFRAKDRLGGFVALKRLATEPGAPRFGASTSITETSIPVVRPGPSPDAPTAPAAGSEPALPQFATHTTRVAGVAVADFTATVQRAVDTLTGPPSSSGPVATRPLRREPARELDDRFSESGMALRLALTQEFQTLASVRHPNIINVLDYGFDEDGQPYFTMELLESARSILRAGLGTPIEHRVALLEQVLRALVYLHRRGLVHRDLKPANVLVVGDQVKVLDFGLALVLEQARELGRAPAGTPAYMAPELYRGLLPSKSSDLYAVGVMAYELFSGVAPFRTINFSILRSEILEKVPDLAPLDPRVAPVVARLLAKDPRDRYADAAEVMAALGAATGQAVRVETRLTRESFLQAARLVGRDAEIHRLWTVLERMMRGTGSAWLIGGESGVGKSRLLEELRARALVAGATVLRGQEVSEGGGPYQVWREVLRWLVLLTDPEEKEAGVLKALVPDLRALLDRDVDDAPEIEPDAAQTRLHEAVEELLRSLDQPVIILLEDLHWARSDSLKLLGRVSALCAELPLVVVGSYRDDERPDLLRELPAMQSFKLDRLDPGGIAELSRSMIGAAGARPELIARLAKETEGNPFFLVEVVRALADEAGQLDRIGVEAPSISVSPRGLSQIITRRLGQAPERARPLLEAAAVAGRQLDLEILHAVDPALDLDEWLASCTGAAVLDVQDGAIRFAHDKLREGILAQLGEIDRARLHRRVAEAIEAVYPDAPEHTAALAFHWAAAGQGKKAARYCGLAGEQALQSSAYQEAVGFFQQALSMLPESRGEAEPIAAAPASTAFDAAIRGARRIFARSSAASASTPSRAAGQSERLQRARWMGQLSDAVGRLGDHVQGARYGEKALAELGLAVPSSSAGYAAGFAVEALLVGLTRVWPGALAADRSGEAHAALSEATRIQNRITEICFYTEEALPMLWSGMRALNLGEAAGPSADLARGYLSMGIVARVVGLGKLSNMWCARGIELAERTAKPYELAWVIQRDGATRVMCASFSLAEARSTRALEIAERSGDRRQWEESTMILAFVWAYQGRFAESVSAFAEAQASGKHRDDPQVRVWGAEAEAWCDLRLGRVESGMALLEASLGWSGASGPVPDVINGHGLMALGHLLRGSKRLARESAERAVALIAARRPVAYWIQQSVSAVAQVLLTLLEEAPGGPRSDKALFELCRKAVKGAKTFAEVFALGRPAARVWRGLLEQLSGDPKRARASWEAAIAEATRLEMPYEKAQAHFQIGRHAPRGSAERRDHLRRAEELFLASEADPDLLRTRAELAR